MPSQKKKLSVAVSNGLLSLDSPGEFAFISHAHSDHISALKSKKLIASEEATFRMRVGRWRISFDIDTVNKNIIIYRIKQRQEGYD